MNMMNLFKSLKRPTQAYIRTFTSTLPSFHGHDHIEEDAPEVNVSFILKDGTNVNIVGREGQNLLRLAQANDIPMEEGTSTIDRDKIKSTIARFKTNIKKNTKRSVII